MRYENNTIKSKNRNGIKKIYRDKRKVMLVEIIKVDIFFWFKEKR